MVFSIKSRSLLVFISLSVVVFLFVLSISVSGLKSESEKYAGPSGACNGFSEVHGSGIDDWTNACVLTSFSRLNANWHNLSSEEILNKLKEALKDKKYKNTDWKTRGITDIPGFYDAKSSVINAMLNRSVGEDLLAREVLNWNASSNSPAGVSPFKGKVPCPRLGDYFVITMLQPGGAIHTIECTATSDFDCVAGTGSMICTDDSRQPGSATLTLTVSSTGDLSGSVQPFGGGASFSLSSGFVVIRVV